MRPRDDPTSEDVLAAMEIGGCEMVADVVDELAATADADEEGEDGGAASRWTVRNRLEELVEDGVVERIDHVNGSVTYHRLE